MDRMPFVDVVEALRTCAAISRPPDETLGSDANGPYLLKWRIERRADGGATYVHHFLRSDAEPELHDHPWDNETLVLQGGYWDVTTKGKRWLGPGDRLRRQAGDFHRVELEPGIVPVSLFTHGPRSKDWCFMDFDGTRIAKETVFDRSRMRKT